MRKEMNMELLNEMDFYVCDHYGYIDEFIYSDLLFIIKFSLGMTANYRPDDYMYDIFDRLDIVEGCIKDEKLVAFIRNAETGIDVCDEWDIVSVVDEIKKYLMKKEQA